MKQAWHFFDAIISFSNNIPAHPDIIVVFKSFLHMIQKLQDVQPL